MSTNNLKDDLPLQPAEAPTQQEMLDIKSMTVITSKGGIRNKKLIAYYEKTVYP